MRVHVNDASYVPKLVEDLLRGGCVPSTVEDGMLDVIHPYASNAAEARTELTFFLRAWRAAHPEVELTFS